MSSELRDLTFALFVIGVIVSTIYLTKPLSAPVPVAEAPKQLYHVVYFWSCDQLVGSLLTTDPIQWFGAEDGAPRREIIDMMVAVEGTNRSVNVKHWHPGCFNLLPPIVLDEQT